MPTQWSSDGNWFWDGTQWQDALSPDGHWRFDGQAWQPFSGQRSPMPPPPATVAAPPAAAQETYPSWMAQEEVARLEQERVQREHAVQVAALTPAMAGPVPWANVHAEVIRQGNRRYQQAGSWWQVGVPSVLIYIVLLLFCFPACGIYVRWGTRWSSGGKWIGYGVLLGLYALGVVLRLSNSG